MSCVLCPVASRRSVTPASRCTIVGCNDQQSFLSFASDTASVKLIDFMTLCLRQLHRYLPLLLDHSVKAAYSVQSFALFPTTVLRVENIAVFVFPFLIYYLLFCTLCRYVTIGFLITFTYTFFLCKMKDPSVTSIYCHRPCHSFDRSNRHVFWW